MGRYRLGEGGGGVEQAGKVFRGSGWVRIFEGVFGGVLPVGFHVPGDAITFTGRCQGVFTGVGSVRGRGRLRPRG